MGISLREKEKAVLDILSRHPVLNARLGPVQEKVDLELIFAKSMRSRTHRYDEPQQGQQKEQGEGEEQRGDRRRARGDEEEDLDQMYRKSSIEMESILEQSLIDMENLRGEKDQIIDDLKKKLDLKTQQLEDSLNRFSTVRHYANLLIKSSNIYIHKTAEEISESDKVQPSLSPSLSLSQCRRHIF